MYILVLEEAKMEQGSDGSKKGELLKPLEAPSYLLTKSLELFNSFKDSKGRFNATGKYLRNSFGDIL